MASLKLLFGLVLVFEREQNESVRLTGSEREEFGEE
jgi:hypothetical protein